MKRIAIAFAFVFGSAGYAYAQRGIPQADPANSVTLSDASSATSLASLPTAPSPAPVKTAATEFASAPKTSSASPAAAPVATPVPQPAKKSANGLSDGTFTGSTAYEPYGPIQIAIVVSGGKISDIKLLQMPQNDRTSYEINAYALPILAQETISAQSANIDSVSGASLTSPAYSETLRSALAKARA